MTLHLRGATKSGGGRDYLAPFTILELRVVSLRVRGDREQRAIPDGAATGCRRLKLPFSGCAYENPVVTRVDAFGHLCLDNRALFVDDQFQEALKHKPSQCRWPRPDRHSPIASDGRGDPCVRSVINKVRLR